MKKFLFVIPVIVLFFTMLIASALSVMASPALQTDFVTATPNEFGRIYYTVTENDFSLWDISAKTGVDLQDIYQMNADISEQDPTIFIGQKIVIAIQTPEPTATVEGYVDTINLEPTSIPEGPGTGTICVLLYEDINGNAFREEEEPMMTEGAVSVSERNGQFTGAKNTIDDPERDDQYSCFYELPEGNYTITMAIPDGFNSTKILHTTIDLTAGDEIFYNFGAQKSSDLIAQQQVSPSEGGRSPLFGILGLGLILVGIGLGVFSFSLNRKGSFNS